MKALHRRSRRHRPLRVPVDFLIPSDHGHAFQEHEFIFLSKEVEAEFAGQEYVAFAPATVGPRAGWTICKVGKWEEDALTLRGRKVAIAGLEGELQRWLDGEILVQSVSPPALETAVFKVCDADYEAVSEDHDSFRRFHDDGLVFRAGKILRTLHGIVLETTLCEPVQQGILGEETEIILVTDTQARNTSMNGLGTPFSTSSQNESNSDLDITQFLALPESQDEFEYISIPETVALDNASARGIPLRVHVLERPVDKSSLDPRPADSEDDEFRVYANMRDIARIGVFSGDWVPSLLSVLTQISLRKPSEPKSSRSVRIYASARHPGELAVPPTLFANLSEPQSILAFVIPPPTIPLAQAILVSRISSPASSAKPLESTFISALKRYFESASRIIRLHDFFALAIDETVTHFPTEELPDYPTQRHPNTIAWYRVEKVTIKQRDQKSQIGKKAELKELSVDYGGDVYVDPTSTKMLQSFYANALIPLKSMALHSYLGIPHLPLPKDETLLRMKGFQRLRALAEAMLSRFGREADIGLLSVLIHGQRGVGKKTVAERVATRLGLHFFEVRTSVTPW